MGVFMKAACALFAALALGGCCFSGTVCNMPQPSAAIGLNEVDQPAEDASLGGPATNSVGPATKQRTRSHANKGKDEYARSAPDSSDPGSWEAEQAQEQADEARLKRKLIICQNCGAAQPQPSATQSQLSEERMTR